MKQQEKVAVVVEHAGITIAYDETANVWRFELRGSQRRAESLAKAKEAIDKPAPKDKKPFARTKAYRLDRYGDHELQEVEVTSVAGFPRYSRIMEVWVSGRRADGYSRGAGPYREKLSVNELRAFTEGNSEKAEELKELERQKDILEKQAEKIRSSLTPFTLSKDTEVPDGDD